MAQATRLAVLCPLILLVVLAAGDGRAAVATGRVAIAGNHSLVVETLKAPQAAPYNQILQMRAVLKLQNTAALQTLLRQLQDPNSATYHHWLATGEFNQRFGPSLAQYQMVALWLRSQGFTVSAPNQAAHFIPFSGTVGQAEKAFAVSIVSADGGSQFGNLTDPTLPVAVAATVGFIQGLDNLAQVEPAPLGSSEAASAEVLSAKRSRLAELLDNTQTPAGVIAPQVQYNGQIGFAPSDIYTFYDETPLLKQGINGSGPGCIGLIEASDYQDQWETNFETAFALPPANLTRVYPNGTGGINGRKYETILDINWSHAIAPGAPINVYIGDLTANDDNNILATLASLTRAVSDNTCTVLSICIETCGEAPSFFTQVLDPVYAQAAAQGQTVLVASGDEGAAEFSPTCSGNGTLRTVSELAADPNVISVGGTQFNPVYDTSYNDVGFVPEYAWDEQSGTSGGLGATTGGASQVFAKPYYQNGLTPADGARDVPDIALEAACNHPGLFFSDAGPVVCCGCGTSFAAPMWDGITRLLNQVYGTRMGNYNPALYQWGALHNGARTGLRDVTMGNNDFNGVVGFNAVPGYDQTTGWGTADIADFVKNFANQPAHGTISVASSLGFGTVALGSLKQMQLKVTNTGDGELHAALGSLPLPFAELMPLPTFAVAPHQSVDLELGFVPTAAGVFTQSLGIASDDPQTPAVNVSLSGKGS